MATHSFTCKQAIPAFTPQPQSITALWLVLILPSHGEYRRLSRPGWLVTYLKCRPRESNPDTVTHPSANRTRRRLTSLIKTSALPHTPNSHGCLNSEQFFSDAVRGDPKKLRYDCTRSVSLPTMHYSGPGRAVDRVRVSVCPDNSFRTK